MNRTDVVNSNKLVPFDEFTKALESGIVKHSELAEYFNVPFYFMCEVLDLYLPLILR